MYPRSITDCDNLGSLGGACSALFILPLAEDFGTRTVFLSTYVLFICSLVPQAVAQSFAVFSKVCYNLYMKLYKK
jgi:predicted MFS family arabinose efflux permease